MCNFQFISNCLRTEEELLAFSFWNRYLLLLRRLRELTERENEPLENSRMSSGSDSKSASSSSSLTKDEMTKEKWMENIEKVEIPRSEVNKLVMNYLVTEGFKDAAEKFHMESGTDPGIDLSTLDPRIKILEAIQNGDIPRAVEMINSYQPQLLDDNRYLFFHLQQQHLIELIRQKNIEGALKFAQENLADQGEENSTVLPEIERSGACLRNALLPRMLLFNYLLTSVSVTRPLRATTASLFRIFFGRHNPLARTIRIYATNQHCWSPNPREPSKQTETIYGGPTSPESKLFEKDFKNNFGEHSFEKYFGRSYFTRLSDPVVGYYIMPLPKVVFVLGGPGAGKGTQCSKIVETFGFVHLSAGDLLREERNKPGSEFGEMIEQHIRDGTIVPVEVTCSLIDRAMQKSESNNFLVDGFPRNQNNLDGWDKEMTGKVEVLFVLFFDAPEDVCVERCLQRGEAGSGRSDDNPESLKKRVATYVNATMPIIEHFKGLSLVRKINAAQDPEAVFQDVRKCFETLA
ncbi:unnamed protein product [Allacma fusca]|uniref:UMP-CMP kinase n=1 Tax=Allacma fusca TaxID=39272 RepID=A0A8J2J5I0_9HEXA|nr:unnamed protein product [Allacma fusca]